MELLIERGATLGHGMVNACLHNGRKPAAGFLAALGAPLDIEGAAGVGRLELVEVLVEQAFNQQVKDAFAWACQFGRTAVAAFLLDHGFKLETPLKHHGQTGLHWTAYGSHSDTVKLLLERGAPINATDGIPHNPARVGPTRQGR